MEPKALYATLRQLIETFPDFANDIDAQETRIWLARAFAIVDACGDIMDRVEARSLTGNLGAGVDNSYSRRLRTILLRRAAVIELTLPADMQGAFIDVGDSFDALRAVGRVLETATDSVLIVDPYMNHRALDPYVLMVREGVQTRLLSDSATVKADLAPTVTAFIKQFQTKRPLEARLTGPKKLHDRLIVVDGALPFSLTQSLNAFAERSPATITRIDGDARHLKLAAYEDYWNSATPI